MKRIRVTHLSGGTSPSTRLPEALLGRLRAGDHVADIARDFGISDEQVRWGLELAAWREVASSYSRGERMCALMNAVGGAYDRRFEVEG